jgi:hypothetical protein
LVRALTRLRSRVPGPFRAGREKLTRSTFQLQIGGSHRVPSQLRAPDRPEAGPSALVQHPRAAEYFRPPQSGEDPPLAGGKSVIWFNTEASPDIPTASASPPENTPDQRAHPRQEVQHPGATEYFRPHPTGRRPALKGGKSVIWFNTEASPDIPTASASPHENRSAVRTSPVLGSTTQVRRIFPATPAPRPPGGLHLTGKGVLRGVQRHHVTGYFRPPAAPEETSRTALGVRGGPRCPRGSTAQDRRIFPAAPPAADDGCVPKKSQRGAPGRCTVTASPPPGTASACTRPP